MAAGKPLDRHAVHETIWAARDRRGLVKIHQRTFAKHLGITGPHMSRVMKSLVEDDRIKKVGTRQRNVGIYSVEDPELWASNGLNQ